MYEFWYYHVKPKYEEKAKQCRMDIERHIREKKELKNEVKLY